MIDFYMPIKGLICLDKIMKMLFGVFSKTNWINLVLLS